ncbi:helix-turn-helix transcriptional regulator [Spartinivicinus ruber]|uniref:helix-turn-helix transcriptional regulator n=1 Tax=Spartinivicinus ruber TaxID=2683272 RepID=UPI0013D44F74|nr:LuxR C-terminal-related transcriptional regulator [Spartinivicinus ruber]
MDGNVIAEGHWQAHLNNPHLAPRETLYCFGLLAGKSDKQIARDCEVSPGTVTQRIKTVHYKLRTHNRAHLVAELIRLKVVTPLLMVLAALTLPDLPLLTAQDDDPNQPRQVRITQRPVRRADDLTTLLV